MSSDWKAEPFSDKESDELLIPQPFNVGCLWLIYDKYVVWYDWCGTVATFQLTHWPLGNLNEILIFKQIFVIDGWGISCEIALIWMSLHFADDQSTMVQVIAWCHQATSHCLSQCWPKSLSPYGVTRPQWVNMVVADGLAPNRHQAICNHHDDAGW